MSGTEQKTAEIGGAKVTINPSEQPAAKPAASAKDFTVTDEQGRTITIAEPDFLSQFRLTEAVGKSASNEAYMNMIRPLLYVKAIDGERVPVPQSKGEIEALIQRLGAEGYNALAQALVEKFVADETQVDRLKK